MSIIYLYNIAGPVRVPVPAVDVSAKATFPSFAYRVPAFPPPQNFAIYLKALPNKIFNNKKKNILM